MRLSVLHESSIPIQPLQYNEKLVDAARREFPDVPEYVANQLLDGLGLNNPRDNNAKKINSKMKSGLSFSEAFKESFGSINTLEFHRKWKLTIITLSYSKLCAKTKEFLSKRNFGKQNPFKIGKDEERLLYQIKSLSKNQPGMNEPIMVLEQPDGLELLEGWHRTMALLWLAANPKNAECTSVKDLSGDPSKAEIKLRAWVGRNPQS